MKDAAGSGITGLPQVEVDSLEELVHVDTLPMVREYRDERFELCFI
jgi:hypothetical protein